MYMYIPLFLSGGGLREIRPKDAGDGLNKGALFTNEYGITKFTHYKLIEKPFLHYKVML